MNTCFIPKNLLSSQEYLSPSNKYKLTIETYKTKPGCWNYTRGIIYKIESGEIIQIIDRNYSNFIFNFFNRYDKEWLFCGKTYYSQCFINLETGELYDNSDECKPNSLCWTNVQANPTGTLLAVEGCIWGGGEFVTFYDFSNPKNGWKEIPFMEDENYSLCLYGKYNTKWINNTQFEYTHYNKWSNYFQKFVLDLSGEEYNKSKNISNDVVDKFYYRVVLELTNKIEYITKESCEEHKQEFNSN
ncbi:hypothetical protein H012_gp815 [Acanthamoeba polyphaga moumouvirus]|uniref:Uncharacterized protein n=1 Tax=Acanthamoeba polyphaga moumouvirus TaxID=1269028 RepID=L7RFP8_9VIRU|nr:hypothetical protein H012_gp815 [Acanthamoeba polyphaga moumouvirus]AGC01650.1 hypothetical protein Moumou_00106 [Acanthamoeba polyphaga moumouvirus]